MKFVKGRRFLTDAGQVPPHVAHNWQGLGAGHLAVWLGALPPRGAGGLFGDILDGRGRGLQAIGCLQGKARIVVSRAGGSGGIRARPPHEQTGLPAVRCRVYLVKSANRQTRSPLEPLHHVALGSNLNRVTQFRRTHYDKTNQDPKTPAKQSSVDRNLKPNADIGLTLTPGWQVQ